MESIEDIAERGSVGSGQRSRKGYSVSRISNGRGGIFDNSMEKVSFMLSRGEVMFPAQGR